MLKKLSLTLTILFVLISLMSVGVFAAETEYTIKMATPSNKEDSNVKAFYYFERLVESRSDGRIGVDVYDSGQLGSHRDYIEGLQMGSMQMAEINTSVLSSISDKFSVFSLPYIAKSTDHMRRVIEDGVGEELSNDLEEKANIKIVGWMIRTPRSVYSASNPIFEPSDFEGMKIRVMESPIMTATMELFGAQPTPISADERYQALQTGVVDAAENSPPLVLTEAEYEVTDYISLTEHFTTPNVIAISSRFYNNLPLELQEIVSQAGRDASHYMTGVEEQQLSTALNQLEDLGMEINEVNNKNAFVEKVKPIYEEYEDEIGEDLINKFVETE